ncbi:MAG: hypothetical protein E7359_02505 [Clostridiales bacterium]|nr:hypothetical protein [Clostridiales bacterium]
MKNKKFYFGKDELAYNIKKIMKNKILSNEKKCDKMIAEYNKYFAKEFINDVKFQNAELNYELYMKKTGKDEYSYKTCFRYEFENMVFYNLFEMCLRLNKLFEKGLDVNKVAEANKPFVNDVMALYNEHFSDKNFDGGYFYMDKDFRNNLKSDLNDIVSKYYKEAYSHYEDRSTEPFPEFN